MNWKYEYSIKSVFVQNAKINEFAIIVWWSLEKTEKFITTSCHWPVLARIFLDIFISTINLTRFKKIKIKLNSLTNIHIINISLDMNCDSNQSTLIRQKKS